MGWLLKVRAWWLFGLAVMLPLLIGAVLYALVAGIHAVQYASGPAYDRAYFLAYGVVAALTITLYKLLQLSWFYLVGVRIPRLISGPYETNSFVFKLSLYGPSITIIVVLAYLLTAPRSIAAYPPMSVVSDGPTLESFTLPIILVWVTCLVIRFKHLIAVIRKLRQSAEQSTLSSAQLFALLFFWPVGIWVLQPKVRAFYLGSRKNTTIDHLVE